MHPRVEIVSAGRLAGEEIRYGLVDSPVGAVFVAFCLSGIVALELGEHEGLAALQTRWPEARKTPDKPAAQKRVNNLFNSPTLSQRVLVKGTDFQQAVWRALLTIPFGQTCTYGEIARRLGQPEAARAVGAAVGANRVGYLIPCHRAVPAAGGVGQYRWGSEAKGALLQWEQRMAESLAQ